MPELTLQRELDVPVDRAWSVFSNFGGFRDWALGGTGSLEVKGEQGPGMIRLIEVEGMGTIGEQLKYLDHQSRKLGYELVEGQPIGMAEYKADIAFEDLGGGRCKINWSGAYTAADGFSDEEVGENLRGSWEGMSASLEAYVKVQG